ncbi:MAG: serine/threonine-protein kinase [Planctomycetota bacterium]|nr:serine/threonine-protein kinase [Planctomycetota bacterium]
MPSRSDLLFAQLLVNSRLLSKEQADSCLREIQKSESNGLKKALGDVILEKELVGEKPLRNAFNLMSRFPYDVRRRGEKIGSYTILRQLGQGGMGPCYEVAHVQRPQETVVLKALPVMMASEPQLRERFFRNIIKAMQCRHVNLGRIIEADVDGNIYYVVQELVPGQTLAAVLDHLPMLEEIQAREVVIQTALGLQKLEEMGACHGGVKPNNILLTHSGLVKLVDLGLSTFSGWGEPLTQPSGAWGTPYYCSPEFGRPDARPDVRSDMYSLGVVFYEMLTGGVPFSGSIPVLDLRRRMIEPWPDPLAKNTNISDNAIEILNRMTAFEPGDRYPDIESLLADLESTLGGRALAVPPLNELKSIENETGAESADTRMMRTVGLDKKDEPTEKPELAPEVDTFYEEAVKVEADGQEKIGTKPLPAIKKKGDETKQRVSKLDGSQELVALLEAAEKLQATDAPPVKSMKLQDPDDVRAEELNEPSDVRMGDADLKPSPLVLIAVSALVTLVLAALLILGLELV